MRQWLQLIKEATPGTTPSADATNSIWIDLEENDATFNFTPTIYKIRSAMPKRGVVDRIAGSSQGVVGGSISTAFYHEQAAWWKSTLLEPAYSGTSPYPPTGLPTFTINHAWMDDSATVRYEQYKRCMFTGYSLTGSNSGTAPMIRLSANVTGAEYNSGATITAPACTAFPVKLYLFTMADLKINNVSVKQYVNNFTLNVTHMITPKFHMNPYPDSYHYAGWETGLQVGMDMFSHAYRTKFLDIRTAFASAIYATNNSLELTYDTEESVDFAFFNMMFSQLNPQRPPNGPHMQDATVTPFYDCTNLDMTCTVTNPA